MANLTTDSTLLEALGIDALAPEEQEAMLLDLNELIFKGTLVRLIERMDEKIAKEYDALVERGAGEDEMLAFFQEKVPDADSAVTETVEELRNDILAVTGSGQD